MDKIQNNTIYGINPVNELISQRSENIERVYFENTNKSSRLFSLLKKCRSARINYQHISKAKLNQICNTDRHQGIAALCPVKPYAELSGIIETIKIKEKNPLLLLPSSIEDPRNLGAVIRSAVAFGVSALILERKNSVGMNATVEKTSTGMLEHIPVTRPSNLSQHLENLKSQQNFQIIGAENGNYSHPDTVDWAKPTILITGGENRGIPPYLKKTCSHFVNIPTENKAGSLNVSVAASILLYLCRDSKSKSPEI